MFFDIFSFRHETGCCGQIGAKEVKEEGNLGDDYFGDILEGATDYVKHLVLRTSDLMEYLLTNNCTKPNIHNKIIVKTKGKGSRKVLKYIAKYHRNTTTIFGKDMKLFPNDVIQNVFMHVYHFACLFMCTNKCVSLTLHFDLL